MGKEASNKEGKLIDISTKTFISVLVLLFALMVGAIILTYVVPKGEYLTTNINGEEVIDYSSYHKLDGEKGINIFKGIFSFILILGSGDGLNLIMLSIFLLVISGAFQAMSDSNGIKVIINRVISKFQNKKFILLSIIALIFMLFGAFLGLFEEMLTLLPIIVILAVSIGYDSFTGFIISIVACGFGFSSAITNPFTVLFASNLIGVNPMINIWFRIIIFIVMYGLLELFIFIYVKKIEKKPESSLTYERDLTLKDQIFSVEEIKNEKKIFNTYIIFFLVVLATIILFSSISAIRDYTVVGLIVIFLIGGILSSLISTEFNFKLTFKSFLKGVLSALPTIIFILMASSIKYILIEGKVLPTITNFIQTSVENKNIYSIAIILFLIILLLEFFISSSTAKAIFVMGILGVLSLGLTKEMQVLIYTFADGYTNLLFPTSPVLLIGLSMIGVSYFKWIKKSLLFFLITFTLVIEFIFLGILIGY